MKRKTLVGSSGKQEGQRVCRLVPCPARQQIPEWLRSTPALNGSLSRHLFVNSQQADGLQNKTTDILYNLQLGNERFHLQQSGDMFLFLSLVKAWTKCGTRNSHSGVTSNPRQATGPLMSFSLPPIYRSLYKLVLRFHGRAAKVTTAATTG